MKQTLLLSILLSLVYGSENYSGQKVLECKLKPELSDKFSTLDVWGYNVPNKTFSVRVQDDKEYKLVTSNTECKVQIEDLDSHIKKQSELEVNNVNSRAGFGDPLFENYQSYTTIGSTLKKWAEENPNYATFIPSIGKSAEGRNIYALILTNKKKTSGKKGIWFNSGLHAREWIGPAATLYSIRKFLDNLNNPEVADLLNTFEYHYTPLSNPDGYEYSRSKPSARMWRKNRRNLGKTVGVDLNRNWNEHWGLVGSSTNPNSETYQGPSPNSEPEVKVLAKYALNNIPNRYGGIDFHSYSQLVLRNWGWTVDRSANEKLLIPLSDAMTAAFKSKGYTYISETAADLFPASGALDDWMASVAKLVSFTVELCPGENNPSIGFQLPASEIVKCSEGNWAAILAYSKYLKQNPNIPPNKPIR